MIRKRTQRGAALIITVVVIMILSTLGLAMVAFTLTEERTASTYRDTMQTRALAEGGVRVVQQMFRTPTERDLIPLHGASGDYNGADEAAIETSLNAIGIWRAPRPATNPARYSGNTNRFFMPPFGDNWAQTFGGTYSASGTDTYDLKFNCTDPADPDGTPIASSDCWLDKKINNMLLSASGATAWSLDSGKITDISFYAPPVVNGRAYGIATVRVTAEKYDSRGKDEGVLLAREVIEALIGDNNISPAIMGDGDVSTGPGTFNACGDGCEQIHANGNLSLTDLPTGGTPYTATATGTVTPAGGTGKGGMPRVVSPVINPWDLVYKPTASADLAKYYLLAARQLDAVWTNLDPADNPAPRLCGLAMCQDYNLEYAIDGTVKTARSAAGTAYLYRWNPTKQGWDELDNGTANVSWGALNFGVTRANDILVTCAAGCDPNAAIPFNKARVPRFEFAINSPEDGATVLVDGMFSKSGGGDTYQMTIIAAGSITMSAATKFWKPASTTTRHMLISGRDLQIGPGSFNNGPAHSACPTDLATFQDYAGIIAVHEQIRSQSQTSLFGLVIAEDGAALDDTVALAADKAIQLKSGDHGYMCGMPDYPWPRPTIPEVFYMTTAAN